MKQGRLTADLHTTEFKGKKQPLEVDLELCVVINKYIFYLRTLVNLPYPSHSIEQDSKKQLTEFESELYIVIKTCIFSSSASSRL